MVDDNSSENRKLTNVRSAINCGRFSRVQTKCEPVPGLKGKCRARTPTMVLGPTNRVLTVSDILRTPLIPTAA